MDIGTSTGDSRQIIIGIHPVRCMQAGVSFRCHKSLTSDAYFVRICEGSWMSPDVATVESRRCQART